MFDKKMFLLPHARLYDSRQHGVPGRGGSGNILNKWTLLNIEYFFLKTWRHFHHVILRWACHFHPGRHYVPCDNILTPGKTLRLNHVYAYKEGGYVAIVLLTDVHIERGFLYCTLNFIYNNELATVCHTMNKGGYILWCLYDIKEYDRLLYRRRSPVIKNNDELLEFDF